MHDSHWVLWILICSFFYTPLKAEEAFYALSSLRFYLETTMPSEMSKEKEASDLYFDEVDVSRLWQIASSAKSVSEKIEEAKSYYTEALSEVIHEDLSIELSTKAQDLLEQAWKELNPCFHQETTFRHQRIFHDYPTLNNNPYVTKRMILKMHPYLLPVTHPIKSTLDAICSPFRILENENMFHSAGFSTLVVQPTSRIRVARHPFIPGYLVKVYLDDYPPNRGLTGWERLINRCIGADNVRKLIKKKKLVHFSVPNKWLYPPAFFLPAQSTIQPVVLVVTDMNIVSVEESVEAWKSKITHQHLDQLYCILSHGFASGFLPFNIPYCKDGKFACLDTEHPKRKVNYGMVKQYLSPEMQLYWGELVRKGGKN